MNFVKKLCVHRNLNSKAQLNRISTYYCHFSLDENHRYNVFVLKGYSKEVVHTWDLA